MMLDKRYGLSTFMTHLLSRGQVVFSSAQAQEALGISRGALLDAAEKQQRRKHLLSPRRGFYVIVPPEYLAWGAPPPAWYIDSLMQYENRPYYVGLLKAAEMHGATHQAVMEFQVVTDKQLPKVRAGRSAIVFYYRKDMDAVDGGLEDHKTDTGRMKVSCPELTALDLLRYSHAAGGLDHIATVLSDLAERIDPDRLADLSRGFERSVVQRLGYLLDQQGNLDRANGLFDSIPKGRALPWIELKPPQAADVDFTPEPVERNDRWHVIVRRFPESDA